MTAQRSRFSLARHRTGAALALCAALILGSTLAPLPPASRAALGDCAQPVSDGERATASDCLFILQAAVGQRDCLPECICGVRGTLPPVATDALACLVMAVGGPEALDCPCAVTSSTTTTTSTTTTLDLVLPQDWEAAFDASELGWMMSGWGPGDGRLWVVGGKVAQGLILQQDAAGWNEVDTGLTFPLLNWVHGTSGSDVFAAGNDGVILHFDGESWTSQATPVTAPVWGLWAVGPEDVWAVGGNNFSDDPPFVLHYDGVEWTLSNIPTLVRPGVHAFFKVWASGPDDVWMVGQNGAVLHYDGEGFTETGIGAGQDLVGIWGNGPEDIMIVGGRTNAEIAHYDGDSWMRVAGSPLPGLNGVWTRRGDVAHAVGVNGTVLTIDPATLAAVEDEVATSQQLHAVFGDAQGQLIALGANFLIPETGVALIRGLRDED